MKKLSIVLAAMLVLALLCSCAKPAPEAPAQADPEPEAPAAVHVTTFPAEILSAADDMLMVGPTDADSTFGTASSVAVRLADGLVPVGADGWPIAVSELTPELQVDITYLGDIAASDPPEVLAVAIRVIPTEQPTTEPDTTTPVQPAEPEPEEPVYEPFATIELPAQDPVPAEIPYDGVTLYGFPAVRAEIVRSGEADLDTDGAMETVQLLRIWDQYDQQSFILRIQKGTEVFDTGMDEGELSYPPSFNARIWLADLDADACPEIYFCGDMASDDYVLNAWSCKSGTPELIPFEDQLFLEASILSISEGSLQLRARRTCSARMRRSAPMCCMTAFWSRWATHGRSSRPIQAIPACLWSGICRSRWTTAPNPPSAPARSCRSRAPTARASWTSSPRTASPAASPSRSPRAIGSGISTANRSWNISSSSPTPDKPLAGFRIIRYNEKGRCSFPQRPFDITGISQWFVLVDRLVV